MAIFNEINKRSGLVVGTVIVALVLFLLTDFLFGKNSFFGRNDDKVGEIAGEKITIEDYQQQIQRSEAEFAITRGASPKESDAQMVQQSAWDQLLYELGYKKQFEKLGLAVTNEEWVDLARGNFIHPMVKQLFGPSFSKEMVNNFIDNLDKAQPQHQQLWLYVDTKLPEIRLREKYSNLLKKTEFITTAEAKREHVSQNQKSEGKYLSVPFASIADSTVTVSDSDLKDYISSHAAEYKVEDGRSLKYVVFAVQPSKEDSARITQELTELAKEFAAADNDSVFAQANSDYAVPVEYKRPGSGPQDLSGDLALTGGSVDTNKVYGPFYHNGSYKLYKILGSKADTMFSARASHILIKDKTQAEKVLSDIKGGASFEAMAKEYGTDGTASKGGDLGWFGENAMVKPFNDAVFNATSKGLLPSLVETQFGFHIIKITEPKVKRLYKVAEVNRNIGFSEETKDRIYSQATEFKNKVSDSAEFFKLVKADSLKLDSVRNVGKNDRYLPGIDNAREVIRWAFKDAKPGDVSDVIAINDKFIVATLTGSRDAGLADVKDVKDEVTMKVRQEKKAAQIIEKLSAQKGSLDEIAKKFGPGATSGTAQDVSLGGQFVPGLGMDPIAIGRFVGLKAGKRSAPFEGQTGVFIVEVTKVNAAPEVADYTSYKKTLEQQRSGGVEYFANEVIKENADVEDDRYKFF
jgi:peptidyl-prolyl cis-trans isomerase D